MSPITDPSYSKIHTVVLDEYRVQVNRILEPYPGVAQNLRAQVREDEFVGSLLELRSYLVGAAGKKVKETIEIRIPHNCFEHLKMNLAPEWFLKRWPVKMYTLKFAIETQEIRLCPHFPGDSFSRHVSFFNFGLTDDAVSK